MGWHGPPALQINETMKIIRRRGGLVSRAISFSAIFEAEKVEFIIPIIQTTRFVHISVQMGKSTMFSELLYEASVFLV